MKGIQFTLEEKQLLVEALLVSSVDLICSDWSQRQIQVMYNLAKRLNEPEEKMGSAYIFENEDLDLTQTDVASVIKDFPNLSRASISNK